VKITKIGSALKRLKKINDEIRYADCFKEKQFTSGLIAFRPTKNSDPKQISHDDKDVVCQVIKGTGRLRVNGKRIPLRPGIICHIPKGTGHDFAAGKSSELVLFFSLVKTR
jgi:quercetin dioxygenase-like cupin family protein